MTYAHEENTMRTRVEALGTEYDAAIAAAMTNAHDLGFREDSDSEAFWAEVLGQVTA